MRERVSVINGNVPILLVAPHGGSADDVNTDLLTEKIANTMDCYAIINRGFDRSDVVDVNNDKADCNRIDHITQDVVVDEFLNPILKIKNRLVRSAFSNYSSMGLGIAPKFGKQDTLLIFYIHGVGDRIHQIANEPVDVIVGYGLGNKKDSLTCKKWRKNLLIDVWRQESMSGEVFEGKGGGKYAGRNSNNLNQYFRKHELDRNVDTMQLEIPHCHRTTSKLNSTAAKIATVLSVFLIADSYDLNPSPKFI
jgi:hypothetical protein